MKSIKLYGMLSRYGKPASRYRERGTEFRPSPSVNEYARIANTYYAQRRAARFATIDPIKPGIGG